MIVMKQRLLLDDDVERRTTEALFAVDRPDDRPSTVAACAAAQAHPGLAELTCVYCALAALRSLDARILPWLQLRFDIDSTIVRLLINGH